MEIGKFLQDFFTICEILDDTNTTNRAEKSAKTALSVNSINFKVMRVEIKVSWI